MNPPMDPALTTQIEALLLRKEQEKSTKRHN